MTKDSLLLHAAELQANLKILESQSHSVCDPFDMEDLQVFKTRLKKYIDAQVKAGKLPKDPLQAIKPRIKAISQFFITVNKDYQQIINWKAEWLKHVPLLNPEDLESARVELEEVVDSIPRIQKHAKRLLSPKDWNNSLGTKDIYPELIACARSFIEHSFPSDPESRYAMYQFAHNEGPLVDNVVNHLNLTRTRIDGLIALQSNRNFADFDEGFFHDDQNIHKSFPLNKFSDESSIILPFGTTKSHHRERRIKEKQFLFGFFPKQDVYAKFISRFLAKDATIRIFTNKLRLQFVRIGGYLNPLLVYIKKSMIIRTLWKSLISLIAILIISTIVFRATNKNNSDNFKVHVAYDNFRGNYPGDTKVLEIAPGIQMAFSWCPPGDFTMGSPQSEVFRKKNENQVDVAFSKGFWIAKTEVTRLQWQAVMGINNQVGQTANSPVVSVSWINVQDFLYELNQVLTKTNGWKASLPTEAQWEYAARAGQSHVFSGCDNVHDVAWYRENSNNMINAVGVKKPNAWGLYDMSGNVMEWCHDYYDDKLPGGDDPMGPNLGSYRVIRGGRYSSDLDECRIASRRDGYYPSYSHYSLGFRIVLMAGIESNESR